MEFLNSNKTQDDSLQWLPVIVVQGDDKREYYVLNFPHDLHPLDVKTTKWIPGTDPPYPRVQVLREELVGKHAVFAIRNGGYYFVVSRELRRLLGRVFPKNNKIMTDDFVLITRHPTPEELLARLSEFFPEFRTAWNGSLFIGKNGSYCVHGVFAEFTSYVRAHYADFSERTWRDLCEYIEQCVTTDVNSQSGIANAACTCFLENIAGEGDLSRMISRYLGPESRKYFDQWDNA
jgi:hypothetical protein